mgnify:CR=1 FL=1
MTRRKVKFDSIKDMTTLRVPSFWLEIGGVALLYLILTLIATYPAITRFGSHFIGDGDTLVNAWNLWWVQTSISNGTSPFHTSMLYYPDGVSLAYHTLNLFNGGLAFLFQAIFRMSLPAVFNTISLLTFIATGVGMFILVRSITGSSLAGVISGLIFTFSPYRMGRVFFGNLDLYSTQFIPWLVLCLIKMRRTPRWRYVIGAAITLSLTGWCSLELGFGTGILMLLLFMFEIISGMAKEASKYKIFQDGHFSLGEMSVFLKWPEQLTPKLKYWLGVVLLTGIFMSPFIVPMIRNYQSFQDQTDQFGASISNSADLAGFFLPDSATSPLIKRVGPEFFAQRIESIYAKFYGNSCEKTVFLGYSVIGMVLVSLYVNRSGNIRRWAFMAGTFFILCLGPVLHVAGRPILSPMPYEFFLHVPLLKFGRSPSRLAIFLMLALAMIVGYGCAALVRQRRRFRWALLLIGALIFIEFLIIPMRLDSRAVTLSSYYVQLFENDQELAVLDIPIDLYGAQGPAADYMLYQTLHHHPIVGGYISRTPTSALEIFDSPFIYQLRARLYNDQAPYHFTSSMMATAKQDLNALGVYYIILHKDKLDDRDATKIYHAMCEVLTLPEYEDKYIAVWYNQSHQLGE